MAGRSLSNKLWSDLTFLVQHGFHDAILWYDDIQLLGSSVVMISFANQAERCCPFQLCIALGRPRIASEEAIDFHLETSTAYRQSAVQASSKPFQDFQVPHLTVYTYLGPSSSDQVVEAVKTVYLTVDSKQILVVVEVLLVETLGVAEERSTAKISVYQMRCERLA